MRILGIDPGSLATGYGVIESGPARLRHLAHGTLRLGRAASVAARLAALQRALAEVIERHEPDVAVIERAFVAASARSALVLGQARGVALATAAAAGVPVCEYAPREIKLAVVGSGAAEKGQVQRMVGRLLGLERSPASDAADALAAAICHAHASRLRALGARGARRRGRRRARSRLVVRRVR